MWSDSQNHTKSQAYLMFYVLRTVKIISIIFVLAINCKKKKCSVFNTVWVTNTKKSSKALWRSCFSDVKIVKARIFFAIDS